MRHVPAIASIAFAMLFTTAIDASIKTETVEYKVGEVTHKGYLAWDDASQGRRPGVIVVHEWWGLNDYPKMRARKLAEMGYVAFCPDMYGEGKTTADAKQAGALATDHQKDMDRARARAMAAYQQLAGHTMVDRERIAAIGYCFGGTSVLNMARAGMPLRGVVSFHGALASPWKAEKGVTTAQVLVCHGADDNFEPPEQLAAFQKEMTAAGVSWQMNIYSGAVHAFTNPDADKAGIPGVAYNKLADERSWKAMSAFLREIFGETAR
jgi:dienelactone hydrolase